MQIQSQITNGIAVVTITGDIDGKSAPDAQAQLLPLIASASRLVLDMNGVGFMSSAGLRMLLMVYRQATTNSGKVALVGLSEEIKDTMLMTGFLNFFVVADTIDAGITALA